MTTQCFSLRALAGSTKRSSRKSEPPKSPIINDDLDVFYYKQMAENLQVRWRTSCTSSGEVWPNSYGAGLIISTLMQIAVICFIGLKIFYSKEKCFMYSILHKEKLQVRRRGSMAKWILFLTHDVGPPPYIPIKVIL